MKRILALILCLALFLALPLTAQAEEPTERRSVFAQCASMATYRDLFLESERFGPSAALTRSMVAVILGRHAGADESVTSSRFGDVPDGAWYAFAADWAISNGILPAMEDDSFHGEQALDRVTLCVALRNYLQYRSFSLEKINAWYSFMDGGTMEKDGRQAVALMQEAGVMIEEPDGFFLPYNAVTVSEAENVFLRFFGGLTGQRFPGMPVSTVESGAPVDDSWFEDACFIGHSQVVGMSKYFTIPKADYYCCVGFKAQDMLDFTYFQGPDRRYGSMNRIFHNFPDTYKKVYIMLGINDCNLGDDRIEEFLEPMRKIMDLVTETQPNATVYILSMAPVGKETPMNTIYNLENVTLYSQALKSLSREYGAEYLDVYRLMAADDGFFQDVFNDGDGIHIKAAQYHVIEEFIRCHTGS